jgi:hypothetical protein
MSRWGSVFTMTLVSLRLLRKRRAQAWELFQTTRLRNTRRRDRKGCSGSARNRLKEDYLLNGQNNYPRTLLQCFNMLKGWSIDRVRHEPANNRLGVAFNTVGEEEEQESENGMNCMALCLRDMCYGTILIPSYCRIVRQ